ncbi:MAG: hypothetical protein P4M00_22050 [Azospirillaceae bacterium]|nr:hypothetical protein [Azospirillaceae bacterium]
MSDTPSPDSDALIAVLRQLSDVQARSVIAEDHLVKIRAQLDRLKPGVVVHLHDIALPNDYDVSFRPWYWNEQYLLAVYLMNGAARIRPLFPTSFVCNHPALAAHFATPFALPGLSLSWKGGGSMWFTHTAGLPDP